MLAYSTYSPLVESISADWTEYLKNPVQKNLKTRAASGADPLLHAFMQIIELEAAHRERKEFS